MIIIENSKMILHFLFPIGNKFISVITYQNMRLKLTNRVFNDNNHHKNLLLPNTLIFVGRYIIIYNIIH